MPTALALTASGTIRPCRFVKVSGAMTGAECDANELAIGITRPGTDYPPINDSSRVTVSGNAAIDGDPISMLTPGDVGLVELGGTVAAGGWIKSDADGKGVAVATTGTTIQYANAQALEGGDSGHFVQAMLWPRSERPALV